MSNALAPGRAWYSLRNWTRAVTAFDARRLALITADDDSYGDDELRLLEARIIRGLSARGLYMFNTQVSAKESSLRLADRGAQIATLGDELARVMATKVFGRKTNPLTTPAYTLRESAVRVVLTAKRALDTDEVLVRLAAMGVHYSGGSVDHTARRDLTVREADTAGALRVASGFHRGRAVYWPATMSARTAIARYDAARDLDARSRPPLNSASAA